MGLNCAEIPGTRIELVRALSSRDFESRASTNSATRAKNCYLRDDGMQYKSCHENATERVATGTVV